MLPSENSKPSSEYSARAPHLNFQFSDVRLADNDPFTLVDDVRDWARADPPAETPNTQRFHGSFSGVTASVAAGAFYSTRRRSAAGVAPA